MKAETEIQQLKKLWFYVIRVEDGDRYLWEVYAKNEVVYIATSLEEAYCKLWQIIEANLFN